MSLAAVNLNHLVALDALFRERSVGRAATRMGVTQSAMSHTLRSLRELTGDPLLVRVGNEMVLTPYAERVSEKLSRGLGDLEAVVSGRAGFDPSTITDTFTLATHDGTAAITSAPALAALRRRAPHAKFRIQPVTADLVEQLADGRVDLAMVPPVLSLEGVQTEDLPGSGTELDSMSVVYRKGHPGVGKKLTLARYCKLQHMMASLSGEGPSFIDHMLAQQGRSREVVVRVPYLLSIAEMLVNSDLVATTITALARFFCERWPLEMQPLPMEFAGGRMMLAWHPRFEADPSHLFFREVMREAARDAVAGVRRRTPKRR